LAESSYTDTASRCRDAPPAIPDHTLLQSIGHGSYGQVWLARTALGQLRAVKIVHRNSFDSDAHYEREFTGLTHFEPISRQHHGLVDILHVGRNDQAGFFYCVMEPADDAGCLTEDSTAKSESRSVRSTLASAGPLQSSFTGLSGSYKPLTLERRIRSGGRMPAAECVNMGVTLADALGHLHQQGLVHRDVKPSNIILIGGVPKLADVGLVTHTANAHTFVGTEGFVPPEGSGTIQADLYSLGKCLYEMAMGKDRLSFPSTPTSLDGLPDREALSELNEIIITACAPNPAARYPTAAALSADLRYLQEGRSVMRRHRRRRRLTLAAWSAAAFCLAATLGWGGQRFRSNQQPALQVVREFSMPGGWPAYRAIVADYDDCGTPELIAGTDGRLAIVSIDGRLLIDRRLPDFEGDSFAPSLVADVNGDDRGEVFASWRKGTNLFVSVFNQDLHEVKRFSAHGAQEPRAVGPHPSSHLNALAFLPESPALSARLIAQITTHYALWPRSIRAYDYVSQSLLWEQPYAATPIQFLIHDLDGDGVPELVLGCYSPNNGARLPDGENDSHTYLHVLSADGRRLWSREVGGTYMRCFVYPAQTGAGTRIYALVVRNEEAHRQSDRLLPSESRILMFDPQGNQLARYEVPLELSGLVVADLAGNGQTRLFTGDSRGFLHILDDHLRLERQIRVVDHSRDWVSLRAELAADLNGNGRLELVLQSAQVEFVSGTNLGRPDGEANFRRYHNHSIHIYDAHLTPKATHTFATLSRTPPSAVAHLLPPEPNGRHQLLALIQEALILELRR
jgi:serine/threonine protein kinase